MPEVISAYISGNGTRAIQCNVTSGGLTVTRAARSDKPVIDGSLPSDTVNEDLVAFLGEADFDDLPLIVSVPSHLGFLRMLRVPFTEEEQIRETAPFELEEYVQSVSVEQMQVDLSIMGLTSSGSRVMAGAMEEEQLKQLIRAVSSSGLDCVSLRFDTVSSFNFLTTQGLFSEEGEGWVVYMNGPYVSITLVEDRIPVFMREFRILPEEGNRKLPDGETVESDELPTGTRTEDPESKKDPAEAQAHSTPGETPAGAGGDRTASGSRTGEPVPAEPSTETESGNGTEDGQRPAQPFIDAERYSSRLIEEMEKTLLSAGVVVSPDRLFLLGIPPASVDTGDLNERLADSFSMVDPFSAITSSGSGEMVRAQEEAEQSNSDDENTNSDEEEADSGTDADRRVEEALQEAVTESSPIRDFPTDYEIRWDVEEDIRDYVVCLGAAPVNAIPMPCDVEMRKGEFAHKKLWETIKYAVAVFVFALLITSVSYLLIVKNERDRQRKIHGRYLQVQEQEFQELYPDREISASSRIPNQLEDYLVEEQEKIGKGLPLKTSALQHWYRMFENVNVRGDIYLNRFSITLDGQGGGRVVVSGQTGNDQLPIRLRNQISGSRGIGNPNESRITDAGENRKRFHFSFPIEPEREE